MWEGSRASWDVLKHVGTRVSCVSQCGGDAWFDDGSDRPVHGCDVV